MKVLPLLAGVVALIGMAAPAHAESKTEILHNVWDPHFSGGDNLVEVYVFYVWRKIDFPFGTNTIETVGGVGYRLYA
jgi:two-component system OmpR family response regulator